MEIITLIRKKTIKKNKIYNKIEEILVNKNNNEDIKKKFKKLKDIDKEIEDLLNLVNEEEVFIEDCDNINSEFKKIIKITKELQEFLFLKTNITTICDINRKLLNYIKKNNLFKEDNLHIKLDKKLEKIFKKEDDITIYNIINFLKKHIIDC